MAWSTPPTFTTGQVVTAAQMNILSGDLTWLFTNCPQLFSESVLGATTASVTFSSIPQTMKHLRIVWQARGDTSANNTDLACQLNGDTGSDYYGEQGYINQSTPALTGSEQLATTYLKGGEMTAATAPGSRGSAGFIELPNYVGTTFHKSVVAQNALPITSVTSGQYIALFAGTWISTSAVTSIKLFPAAGNFVTGSTFSLIGEP